MDKIKLSVDFLQKPIFKNPKTWQVFCFCLFKASHAPTREEVKSGHGIESILVHRGQFVFGRERVARELKVSRTIVYSSIKKLEKAGYITLDTHRFYTLITVCDYAKYWILYG